MVRLRALPAFGWAIHSADRRIWSTVRPVIRAASSRVVLLAASALSNSFVEASISALSTQPLSAMWVSQALKSARSVPELIARCITRSLPTSASQALTVTVRRGSTITIRLGSTASFPNCAFFLSMEVPRRFGTKWFRK